MPHIDLSSISVKPPLPVHLPVNRRIVILISGRGSNMEALIRAQQAGEWGKNGQPLGHIVAIISDKTNAPGLAIAQAYQIPVATITREDYPSRIEFETKLSQIIEEWKPDLILLAGFMRILSIPLVERYQGQMLNIHPSLLPDFPGLNTHERVLAAGHTKHGATVHFVTPELDAGPIIRQALIPVYPNDTKEILAARVLKEEHLLYPKVVREYLDGKIPIPYTLKNKASSLTPPQDQIEKTPPQIPPQKQLITRATAVLPS